MNYAPPSELSVHIAVWHHVLEGWLGWPEQRIQVFVDRHRKFFDPPQHLDPEERAGWVRAFYHRWPAERVIRVLFSPSLRRRSSESELFAIQREIEGVIYQRDWQAHCLPSYDWHAARKRVEAVLERHGAALPRSEDLTWYEQDESQKTNAQPGATANAGRPS
jgi:hypothetical protein